MSYFTKILNIGDIFHNYVLSKNLGEGSFSSVFVARKIQDTSHKEWVIKFVPVGRKSSREYGEKLRSLQRDISVGTTIGRNSSFLIKYFETFEEEGYFCMVMEYCSGGDLQILLNKGKTFTRKDIQRFLAQVGSGIMKLHKEGIVHRDLKPKNIFITENNTFKIGDYNISRNISQDTMTRGVGTSGYIAPESYDGEYTSKSDMYAIGCMMYYMMTGRHPFIDDKGNIKVSLIISGQYPQIPRGTWDNDVILLCQQLMNVNSFNRLSASDLLHHPFVSEFIEEQFDENYEEKDKTKEELNNIKKNEKKFDFFSSVFEESLSSLFSPIILNTQEYAEEQKKEFVIALNTTLNIDTTNKFYEAVMKKGMLEQFVLYLPRKYDKSINTDEVLFVLKKFVGFLTRLFAHLSKEQQLECEAELRKADGYELLFHCFSLYPDLLYKQLLAIIICYVHMWCPLPPRYLTVLVMIKEKIRERLSNTSLSPAYPPLITLVGCLINVFSNNQNVEYFINLNFYPLIIDLLNKNTGVIKKDAFTIFAHIFNTKLFYHKNELVDNGLFSNFRTYLIPLVDYLKGAVISVSSPLDENSQEILQLKLLLLCFYRVIYHNCYGMGWFITSGIIPLLLQIIQILSPFLCGLCSSSNIVNVVYGSLSCLLGLTYADEELFFSSYIDEMVDSGTIMVLKEVLISHNEQVKQNKDGLCEKLIFFIISLFYLFSIEGSLYSGKGKKNSRRLVIDNEIEEVLLDIYHFISLKIASSINSSSPSSSSSSSSSTATTIDNYYKNARRYISIIIVNLYKSEVLPIPLLPHLSSLRSLMLEKPTSGYVDVPKWARFACEGILINKDEKK